jgi:hypothetical protein
VVADLTVPGTKIRAPLSGSAEPASVTLPVRLAPPVCPARAAGVAAMAQAAASTAKGRSRGGAKRTILADMGASSQKNRMEE